MQIVKVTVKGFVIYCENDMGELYDFFLPMQSYRINKSDAYKHIPATHKLIDIKRDSETITVNYEELQNIEL